MSSGIPLLLALIQGIFAFASPCVLPLIPAYLTYITGMSFGELSGKAMEEDIKLKALLHSLIFVLGFTFVFVFLGASASGFGAFLRSYRGTIRLVGGALIIIFGLFLVGIFRLRLLDREWKFTLTHKPLGYTGSFLVGITFAAGWTPCTGPFLASAMMLAADSGKVLEGMIFLFFFSLGMAIPFLIVSYFFNYFLTFFKNIKKYLGTIQLVSGLFLIVVGILLMTNTLDTMSRFLTGL